MSLRSLWEISWNGRCGPSVLTFTVRLTASVTDKQAWLGCFSFEQHAVKNYYLFFYLENEAYTTSSSGSNVVESCVPEKCDLLCTLAVSAFDCCMKRVQDGSITFEDMESINAKTDQFEKLYKAMLKPSEANRLDKLIALLECRRNECVTFKKRRNMLYAFCREITTAKLKIDGQWYSLSMNSSAAVSYTHLTLPTIYSV